MNSATPVLRLRGISKRFGDVAANSDVSLDLYAGRVHGLLGENGAGKSTLISLLAGMQQPDEGTIEIDGALVVLDRPATSISHGIGVVYQHSALIPTMSVIENLMLAEQSGLRLDRRGAEDRLAALGELLGADVPPDTRVDRFGLGQQQQLEIAKALWAEPRVLVLDEPTSMLTPQGVAALTESVRRLAAQGVAVVFVTHKLDEALELCDSVTVMRAGRVALSMDEVQPGEAARGPVGSLILAAMFGTNAETEADPQTLAPADDEASLHPRPRAVSHGTGDEVLRLEGVTVQGDRGRIALNGVSLRVASGEILGIAGIDGHGQRELAEAIAGQTRVSGGQLVFEGRDLGRSTVKQRQRLGIRYVTDDRLHEGIIGQFSVALNLVLKQVGDRPIWRFGRLRRAELEREAGARASAFDVRAASLEAPAGVLSGGNIQKVLLARELSAGAKLVIFNKPSYGLDLRTVQRVRAEIERFASEGGAVLLMSTDLDELASLCDRIAVISRGRIVGEVENRGNVRGRLGELIAGEARA